MTLRSLMNLLQVRRIAVEEARRSLACAVADEGVAANSLCSAIEALRTEYMTATDLTASDIVVEAYTAWLPLGRARVLSARNALQLCTERTAQARLVLAAAQAAAEVTLRAIVARAEAVGQAELRSDQAATDEAARRMSIAGGTEVAE